MLYNTMHKTVPLISLKLNLIERMKLTCILHLLVFNLKVEMKDIFVSDIIRKLFGTRIISLIDSAFQII